MPRGVYKHDSANEARRRRVAELGHSLRGTKLPKAHCEKISSGRKKWWTSLTAEERRLLGETMSAGWAARRERLKKEGRE